MAFNRMNKKKPEPPKRINIVEKPKPRSRRKREPPMPPPPSSPEVSSEESEALSTESETESDVSVSPPPSPPPRRKHNPRKRRSQREAYYEDEAYAAAEADKLKHKILGMVNKGRPEDDLAGAVKDLYHFEAERVLSRLIASLKQEHLEGTWEQTCAMEREKDKANQEGEAA